MANKSAYKFNWIITGMEAIPEHHHLDGTLCDVVEKVYWSCEIYDPTDHSIDSESGHTVLDIHGVNPSSYTDFLELTKEQIIEWVKAVGDIEQVLVDKLEYAKSDYLLNEARPVAAPWLASCCPDGTGITS